MNMDDKIKKFYYVEAKGSSIEYVYDPLCHHGPLPLIWNNNGLYGIICKEKIENAMLMSRDQANLPVLNPNLVFSRFFWDEVEKLDPKIAKLLLGE